MSKLDQAKTILCPTKMETAKIVNKFIGIMFQARAKIDQKDPSVENLTYPTWKPGTENPFTSNEFSDESISSNDISYHSESDSD